MGLDGLTIISGGQTGADRAALDWAIEKGVPHGGWCPRGRKAEDGSIDLCYQLRETPTAHYVQRTEWNVRDSDATVILALKPLLAGGSQKTLDFARRQKKPCLVLSQASSGEEAAGRLQRFLQEHRVRSLHVAGPRASEEPGIGEFVKQVLDSWYALQGKTSAGLLLSTPRLVLRRFTMPDAPALARLAGAREIADTTISIPHPYSEDQALLWIARTIEMAADGIEVALAVALKDELIGGVGLRDINQEHSVAELGFWIAVPFWGKGYGTEAAQAALEFGFDDLRLNRICAHHMVRNLASGRVLTRIGMKPEGRLRQRVRKWGVFEDVIALAILREEWLAADAESNGPKRLQKASR